MHSLQKITFLLKLKPTKYKIKVKLSREYEQFKTYKTYL